MDWTNTYGVLHKHGQYCREPLMLEFNVQWSLKQNKNVAVMGEQCVFIN